MPADLPAGERAELYREFCQTRPARSSGSTTCCWRRREARRWFLEAGRIADAAEMLADVANGDRRTGVPLERRRATDRPGHRRARGRGARRATGTSRWPPWSASRRSTSSTRLNFDEAQRLNDGLPRARRGAAATAESTLDAEFFAAQIALVGRRGRSASLERLVADRPRGARRRLRVASASPSFRVAATMAARVMDYRVGRGRDRARASSTPTRSSSRTAASRWRRRRR